MKSRNDVKLTLHMKYVLAIENGSAAPRMGSYNAIDVHGLLSTDVGSKAQLEYRSVTPHRTAGSELTLAEDVECFWLSGSEAAAAAAESKRLAAAMDAATSLDTAPSRCRHNMRVGCITLPAVKTQKLVWTQ